MTMNEEQRWKAAKALVTKIDQAKDKVEHAAKKIEQFSISAGQHLKVLKADHDKARGSWAEWEAKCKEKVGISKSRASDLIAIADGRKTVNGVRKEAAQRKREHDKRKKASPLRNGEKQPPAQSREMEAK
jgi:hypothetical protein